MISEFSLQVNTFCENKNKNESQNVAPLSLLHNLSVNTIILSLYNKIGLYCKSANILFQNNIMTFTIIFSTAIPGWGIFQILCATKNINTPSSLYKSKICTLCKCKY